MFTIHVSASIVFFWMTFWSMYFHFPDCSIWHEASQWGCWDACIHLGTNSSTFPSPWNGKLIIYSFQLICHDALCYSKLYYYSIAKAIWIFILNNYYFSLTQNITCDSQMGIIVRLSLLYKYFDNPLFLFRWKGLRACLITSSCNLLVPRGNLWL